MALISGEELMQALGQNPDLASQAGPALDDAIARATLLLQTQLDTCLSAQNVTDTFVVDEHTPCRLRGFVRLRLSNGSVKVTDDIVVTQADEFDGDYVEIASTSVLVDYKKGLVQIRETAVTAEFLKVNYTSGYTEEDEAIPEEIVQALMCYAPLLLLSSSSATDGEAAPAKSVFNKYKSLHDVGQDMSFPYHRGLGAVVKPVHSDVTALT